MHPESKGALHFRPSMNNKVTRHLLIVFACLGGNLDKYGLSHLFVFLLNWTEYGKDNREEDEPVEEAKEADHEEDLEEGDEDVRLGGDQQGEGKH